MARLGDVLYFLRQILFPNWKDRDEDEPTRLQKILTAIFLYLTSRNGTGTLFSIILHTFILVILALIPFTKMGSLTGIDILGSINVPGIEQAINTAPVKEATIDNDSSVNSQAATQTDTTPVTDPITTTDLVATATTVEPTPRIFGEGDIQTARQGGFVFGGGYGNRTAEGRRGTTGDGFSGRSGEDAVEAALRWFVAHQQPDGGWSLYFDDSCKQCSHSGMGNESRRTAATALALLSFLGAGYSHQKPGEYQEVVSKGLRFLIENPNGGINGAAIQRDKLRMYSQGLAAIALCEAYALSREQNPKSQLGVEAQKALQYIETAQTEYGGWNYRQDQRERDDFVVRGKSTLVGGDTSIFLWQLMALKSGQIGGLYVSQSVLYAAHDFLDSVALDGGRQYQYTSLGVWDAVRGEDSPKTCTAIGLLARMYLGWKPGDPFLDDGMKQLVSWGSTLHEGRVNLYYAYHATLALHHYGGDDWDEWNSGVRELLIQTQSRQGHESGSWYFDDPYCNSGGRLLNTALAVMILETPYRFMPLYREIQK
jgi:hypothetical protein